MYVIHEVWTFDCMYFVPMRNQKYKYLHLFLMPETAGSNNDQNAPPPCKLCVILRKYSDISLYCERNRVIKSADISLFVAVELQKTKENVIWAKI